MATLHPFSPRGGALSAQDGHPPAIAFSRSELSQMLSVYSRRVMSGEWRDYAIDQQDGLAMFSVFRNTHEQPLFAIVKRAADASAAYAGAEYALFHGPERLGLSSSLIDLLATLESRPRLVQG